MSVVGKLLGKILSIYVQLERPVLIRDSQHGFVVGETLLLIYGYINHGLKGLRSFYFNRRKPSKKRKSRLKGWSSWAPGEKSLMEVPDHHDVTRTLDSRLHYSFSELKNPFVQPDITGDAGGRI